MRPPDQPVDHHHYVKPGKRSAKHPVNTAAQTRGRPTSSHDYQRLLTSVSTDQRPLLRQDSTSSESTRSASPSPSRSFIEQYGRCLQMVHYGIHSTTRLHQSRDKQLVAIKVYRRTILRGCPNTSHSASLHSEHPNILPILNLLHNERGELCLVMPHCAGGDLNTLLARHGSLPPQEADCIMTQILRALAFLHNQDTAHRDIRLETVLLTARGAVKLAGFGDGHIRRIWENSVSRLTASGEARLPPRPQPQATWSSALPSLLISLCRSSDFFSRDSSTIVANTSTPSFVGMSLSYVPPEGFKSYLNPSSHHENRDCEECDPRPADVWATAITYMALVTDGMLWGSARPHREDARYLEYLDSRCGYDGYPPIEALGQKRRNAIYAMLHPDYWKRITTAKLLRSEWIQSVEVCEAGANGY
ncbi:hypothetical protein N7457_004159 [Penicillium paradoxum]|uniref:uncharacterized protein n=1 Tax=Penicillium paradoxum TaxID=176176 RepID=UPI0025468A90|nr:uncharacterized protein N7457_004159 [Penicillium paradoxum]KAJ5782385.1 hypothetical protein N7457_004159 [Penicillium paradoxum]